MNTLISVHSENELLDNNTILSSLLFEKRRKNKQIKKEKNETIEKIETLFENDTILDTTVDTNLKQSKFNLDEIENHISKDIIKNCEIKCNNCNSKKLFEIDGYNVCNDCGLYNDCVIDAGQEWRFYGNDDSKGNDPARCDMPTSELLPNTSMGALIGFASTNNIQSKKIRNMIE